MSSYRFSRRSFLASTAVACAAPQVLCGDEPSRISIKEVPWLEEVQTPPKSLPPSAPKLRPLLVDAAGKTITTREAWEQRREEIRRSWWEFLQPPPRWAAPSYQVLEEDREAGVLRRKIAYETEPGVAVEAYLIEPLDAAPQRPGVVVLHSTVDYTIRQPAGLEGPPEKAFGLKLAQQGVTTLSPRNFLWTAEKKGIAREQAQAYLTRRPGSKGMAKMLHDALVAMDLLATLPGVDPQRLGAVGHSLGAKEVLYLAAFDERVKAAVSSEGGVGVRFSNWDAPWYLGEAVRQPSFDREHHELLALAAPRAFLLIGGDSADGDASWPFIEAALPVYRLYGEPARLGLFNHKQGHAVPPVAEERIAHWILTYL